jgi:biopolymer transport protein TolR
MQDPMTPHSSSTVAPKPDRVALDWEESLPASRIRRRKRRYEDPLVNLTSMVDVLSVLMFFLLTIYTGGGFLTVLPQGLVLPNSTTTASLTRNLEVSVLKDKILVEREAVGDDPQLFADNEELLLPALQRALTALAPADETKDTRVTIAADRAIPFRLLKKVMYTVDQAGFRLQSLAVKSISG